LTPVMEALLLPDDVGAGAEPEEEPEPPELVPVAVAAGSVEVTTADVAEMLTEAVPCSTVKYDACNPCG